MNFLKYKQFLEKGVDKCRNIDDFELRDDKYKETECYYIRKQLKITNRILEDMEKIARKKTIRDINNLPD